MSVSRVARLLSVSALGVACAAPEESADSSIAAERSVQEGVAISFDGAQIAYRLVGSGPDTLVVIHGGPGFTMDYLAADLEPLAEHHTLLFNDQRGTGRSTLVTDSAALDAQRFVDDLEALRRHLSLGSVNLLGHSWGAAIAALLAREPGLSNDPVSPTSDRARLVRSSPLDHQQSALPRPISKFLTAGTSARG